MKPLKINKIKLYRLEAGLSQAELALKTGRSVTAISKLENGKIRPSLVTMQRISQVLGVSLDELVESFQFSK